MSDPLSDIGASTRAEYVARINRVQDHIEAHLHETLSLERLASVACFSPFHFHRLFRAMVGETLARYIRRLRLEKAASMLLHQTHLPITEVALTLGFGSSSTFARAFKDHFGVSASAWRRRSNVEGPDVTIRKMRQTNRKACEVIEVTRDYLDPATHHWRWRLVCAREGGRTMTIQVSIVERPETPIVYVRHQGPYANNSKLFAGLIGQLMGWAGPRGLFRPPSTELLTVYHDDPSITDESQHRISVGMSVPADTTTEGPVSKLTLPGGLYAVGHFEITADGYSEAWDQIFSGWLPSSGYQPDERPCFEIYQNDPNEHPEGKHIVDICIPIKAL